MNEQIDWSKAPEWASVRIRSRATPTLMAWAESYTEGVRFLRDDYDGAECRHLAASFWDLVAERPSTPSWSGEGLPPVGVVCMANGYQVVIVAHHCNGIHAIYAESEYDGLLYYGEPNEFRHIRTKEQIAHDMREAAINEMSRDSNFIGLPNRILLGGLYDAGYRKQ